MSLKESSEAFRQKRDRIRTQMGSTDRVERQHAKGRYTIRERIDRLLDPGTFHEIGTFARSERPEDAGSTPGDGKIGGLGEVNGRPVAVAGDDVTVKRGSSSVIGGRRLRRIFDQALQNGHPMVYFGETGGGRLPDILGSEGFVKVQASMETGRRARAIPLATIIAGESFGGSSFMSAFSDFVVQVKGTCLAVTSPRVIEIATSESIGFEELGGVDVHDRLTGQLDRVAEDEDEAIALVKEFLSYLPDNAWSQPPTQPWDGQAERDEKLYDIVPERRQRAYDMRRVLRRLTDDGKFFELKPNFGRALITGLGRMAGRTVGFVASQPLIYAGALTPAACDKATSFLCLCDAFNIPLVFLQDTPGFMVGKQVEHDRILSRAIMFLEAMALCRVPRLTVVLRKAFGLAFFSLSGAFMDGVAVAAWPGAEISFMDPEVGVNVVHGDKLTKADDPAAARAQLTADWTENTGPEGAAGIMALDEIIDPAETRAWLATQIARLHVEPPPWGQSKPLAYWPTCY